MAVGFPGLDDKDDGDEEGDGEIDTLSGQNKKKKQTLAKHKNLHQR